MHFIKNITVCVSYKIHAFSHTNCQNLIISSWKKYIQKQKNVFNIDIDEWWEFRMIYTFAARIWELRNTSSQLNIDLVITVGSKTFDVLGKSTKLCLFNYLNVFCHMFFVAKDSFIIRFFKNIFSLEYIYMG